MKFEDYISLNAEKSPNKIALVCDKKEVSYSLLYREICVRAEQWKNSGVTRGTVFPLVATNTIEYLISYFAIHLLNAVAVPLQYGTPESGVKAIENELANFKSPEGTADILYTTGTTGKSKGVIISHKAIIADAENLIDAQKFTSDIIFIIGGPLNHAGCWSKVFPTLMVGGTIYLISGMKNLDEFYGALDYKDGIYASFLVPANIRILLQMSAYRLSKYCHKIDFIETGAAPITHSDMKELCKILPESRLYNTYASTETGIISTYNFNDGKCTFGCLGKPMKHSTIIISQEGTIICKGDTIMSGYANDHELTSSILRDNAIYTSDRGELDTDGMLHLLGRTNDIINIGGYKVAPTEVEEVALELPEIIDCICIPSAHKIMGSVLKLLVVLDCESLLDKRKIAMYIKSKLENYKVPMQYEQVDKIERTFNGKINRKFYNSPI